MLLHEKVKVLVPTALRELTMRDSERTLQRVVDKYDNRLQEQSVVIDFRTVGTWDLDALLWFSLGLKDLRDKGIDVRLMLPDKNPELSKKYGRMRTELNNKSIQSSANYLRSCKFDLVLRHMGGVHEVLVPEQGNFFTVKHSAKSRYLESDSVHSAPKQEGRESIFVFYDFASLERRRSHGEEIRSRKSGGEDSTSDTGYELRISKSLIDGRMRDLYHAAASGVFERECKLSLKHATRFLDSVVGDILDSVEQRPNASLGLMVIGRSLEKRTVTIAVADDGEPICYTVLKRCGQTSSKQSIKDTLLDFNRTAELLDLSTSPEMATTPDGPAIGLFYAKKHTLSSFGGTMRIVSSNVSCDYVGSDLIAFPTIEKRINRSRGNLVQVVIPMEVDGD